MRSRPQRLLRREGTRPGLDVVELPIMDALVDQAWRALDDGLWSPHQSAALLDAYRVHGDPTSASALVALEPDSGVVGLLPVERWIDASGRRTLGALGSRWLAADGLDVMASPERRLEVALALHRHVAADPGWDQLTWRGLGPSSAMAASTRESYRPPRHWFKAPRSDVFLILRLEGDDLGNLVRSANLRKSARRAERAAERHSVGVREVGREELSDCLGELSALHRSQFPASPLFETDDRVDIVRSWMEGLAHAGRLRAFTLGSSPAACLIVYLVTGDVALAFVAAQNQEVLGPDVNALSALLVLTLPSLVAGGVRTVDFGRGRTDVKRRLASGIRFQSDVRIVRTSPATVRALAAKRFRSGAEGEAPSSGDAPPPDEARRRDDSSP